MKTLASNRNLSSSPTDRTRLDHARPDSTPAKETVAYIVSQYPALSHTFIKKEIEWLEREGRSVEIVSIRKPANLEVLGDEGRRDADRTFYLLSACGRRLLPAVIRSLFAGAKLSCMISTWLRVVRRKPFALSSYAYLAEAFVLLDWMRSREIHHTHNHFGNAAGTVAMIASASHLVGFSLSIHGPDIFYDVDQELLPLKLESARFSRAISHYCRSQMCLQTEPRHWPRFEIVRCGIDPDQFSLRPDPANAKPRILCVGRLVPAKGQALLLEAAAALRDEGLDFDLVIVGTGPDQESLRQSAKDLRLEDRVEFTGGMDPSGVRDQYAVADVFVLPSFAEGVPIVLMEAMASGVPVISTRITGIPELIESGRDGLLVAASDTSGLRDAIRELICDPEKRKQLATAAREKVCRFYNLDENGRAMASLFDKHLS